MYILLSNSSLCSHKQILILLGSESEQESEIKAYQSLDLPSDCILPLTELKHGHTVYIAHDPCLPKQEVLLLKQTPFMFHTEDKQNLLCESCDFFSSATSVS